MRSTCTLQASGSNWWDALPQAPAPPPSASTAEPAQQSSPAAGPPGQVSSYTQVTCLHAVLMGSLLMCPTSRVVSEVSSCGSWPAPQLLSALASFEMLLRDLRLCGQASRAAL